MDTVKQKLDKFWKLAFVGSVIIILLQGLIKLIFNVDWINLEATQRMKEFYLFNNNIYRIIINQLGFMFNTLIILAISNNQSIKNILIKTWWMLILTYLLNLLPKNVSFVAIVIIAIIINLYYNKMVKNDNIVILKTCINIFVMSLVCFCYQPITLLIRLNELPPIGYEFDFFVKLIFSFDLYLMLYFIYKSSERRKQLMISWFWIGNIEKAFERFIKGCKSLRSRLIK